tara:strand:- start:3085 stop:3366 length:282 start_codon:yes stop_codon:yes gene_type:complete
MNAKTKKDDLFDIAQAQYGKKLDRRLSLADLQDQVSRLEQLKDEPQVVAPSLIPSKVQNVVTGNVFEYHELFAGNPDLQIIEWAEEESENGDN